MSLLFPLHPEGLPTLSGLYDITVSLLVSGETVHTTPVFTRVHLLEMLAYYHHWHKHHARAFLSLEDLDFFFFFQSFPRNWMSEAKGIFHLKVSSFYSLIAGIYGIIHVYVISIHYLEQ